MDYKIEKIEHMTIAGREYGIQKSTNKLHKPWIVSDITSGNIPIFRSKTKKEAIKEIIVTIEQLEKMWDRLK